MVQMSRHLSERWLLFLEDHIVRVKVCMYLTFTFKFCKVFPFRQNYFWVTPVMVNWGPCPYISVENHYEIVDIFYLFIYSLVCLFIHSFIYSFIYTQSVHKLYEKLHKFTGWFIGKIMMAKQNSDAPYCEEWHFLCSLCKFTSFCAVSFVVDP